MEHPNEQQESFFETRDILQYSLGSIVILFLVSLYYLSSPVQAVPSVTFTEPTTSTHSSTVIPINPFGSINLNGKAAIVYDSATKQTLFADNADTPLPLASLTKVMTAITASELGTASTTIEITPRALATEGDSRLLVREHWGLRDLISYMLVVSSNDGAKALALSLGSIERPAPGDGPVQKPTEDEAEQRFITAMNATASKLNLRNTHFNNETGLDETILQGGSYGSARDMATLFSYMLANHPELLIETQEKEVVMTSKEGVARTAKNTNHFVDEIPGILGSKTGYTDLAGGNLVIAFDAGFGRPIIAVVLGSTPEGRFQDISALAEATRHYFMLAGIR
jgi:D-alanyl-D-alanine carboxypeptidase (penicillin-binding protein 5/6)